MKNLITQGSLAFSKAVASALTISLLLISSNSWSADPLLHRGSRPTITEYLKQFAYRLPAKNPYGSSSSQFLQSVRLDLPRVVAELEKLYPGAIYAGLGRDSVALADALDAFYISIGQPDRIRRLGASRGTINTATQNQLYKFLRTNGLDFSAILKGKGFIIFDRTQFGANSQSRTLIKAAYSEAEKQGFDIKRMGHLLTVVSTNEGLGIKQNSNPHDLKSPGAPTRVFKINAGDLTDTEAWHDSFGSLYTQGRSTLAQEGPRSLEKERRLILAEMYEVIEVTRSDVFLEKVRSEALALGYEFPYQRPKSKRVISKHTSPEIAIAQLEEFVSKQTSYKRELFSEELSAEWIKAWFLENRNVTKKAAEALVVAVTRLLEKHEFSDDAARWLVFDALSSEAISQQSAERIRKYFAKKKQLRETAVLLFSSLGGRNALFDQNVRLLLPACGVVIRKSS